MIYMVLDRMPSDGVFVTTTTRIPIATDAELTQLAQQMWNADINRFPDDKYMIHLQGHTNTSDKSDRAPRKYACSLRFAKNVLIRVTPHPL